MENESRGMTEKEKIERMKELGKILSEASYAYYQQDKEIMSNFEYDRLYDELLGLEKETGIVLAGSPTQRVGYEVVGELPKETHESPMLSLDKTKSLAEFEDWLGDQPALLSWKLDGLTVVLTYENGELAKAVTRGNGVVGEVITNNARVFVNIPLKISYTGTLIIRGEAVISYEDFNRINEEIDDVDARYKNPRNLCSGSVRQLNNEITAQRNVRFLAFMLVRADGVDFHNSHAEQFEWLKTQGFDVVPYKMVDRSTLAAAVQEFAEEVSDFDIPSDGLVLLYDNIAYGESLGRTAKFPRNSMAFKWADETAETTLRFIEWSASRTGLINPVAVFDPVSLEGTTVTRASVHNISVMQSLKLGVGDAITVYKANMIIPQIADDLTGSANIEIPKVCPVCGGATEVRDINGVKTLYCTNPDCQAKKVKSFALLASRDALNIDGLSEMTLEKFIAAGLIHTYADMFRLDRHEEAITSMEGFGKKSFDKLVAAAKTASNTTMTRLLYGLGIAGIGLANARMISAYFHNDFEAFRHAGTQTLTSIEGIGEVLARGITDYFSQDENNRQVDELLTVLTFGEEEENALPPVFAGMTFVITGSLHHFANRRELQDVITGRGGHAATQVSSQTTYLINNDKASSSAKNRKARELGIPVISEEDFLNMLR